MIRSLLLIIVLLTKLHASSIEEENTDAHDEWESYKKKFGKSYADEEDERLHMEIFHESLRKIVTHNKLGTFKLALNHFSDVRPESMTCVKEPSLIKSVNETRSLPGFKENAPAEWDWRNHGVVTSVKRQGKCLGCWAFATVAAVEGAHASATGRLVDLSPQHLIDCATEGSSGCKGGDRWFAFQYIKYNGGVATEQSYPYKETQERCHARRARIGATIRDFHVLPEGDEDILMHMLYSYGPMSAAVDASHYKFRSYSSGVHYDRFCKSEILNHAITIVGYGEDTKEGKYWTVKNSWGTQYGESGYIRMSRNRDNNCNIASFVVFPIA